MKKLNEDEIIKRYKKHGLIYFDKYINCRTKLLTKCKCGILWYTLPKDIFHDKGIRCKECAKYSRSIIKSKIKIGDKFGRLIVIKKDWSQYTNQIRLGRPFWIVKCECGNIKKVDGGALRSGLTSSCGNCRLFKNGKRISLIQIKLLKLLNCGILNFKSGKYFIDIAFIKNNKKIAIEYDSKFWHKNRYEKDIEKTKYLLDTGWKVLRIKSDWLLPEISELNFFLNELINSDSTYQEIILKDWR